MNIAELIGALTGGEPGEELISARIEANDPNAINKIVVTATKAAARASAAPTDFHALLLLAGCILAEIRKLAPEGGVGVIEALVEFDRAGEEIAKRHDYQLTEEADAEFEAIYAPWKDRQDAFAAEARAMLDTLEDNESEEV